MVIELKEGLPGSIACNTLWGRKTPSPLLDLKRRCSTKLPFHLVECPGPKWSPTSDHEVQCPGRFLGIIGRDLSVSKSNQFTSQWHLWFFLRRSRYIPLIPSKVDSNFPKVLNCDWILLKLNHFNCNWQLVLPVHWQSLSFHAIV